MEGEVERIEYAEEAAQDTSTRSEKMRPVKTIQHPYLKKHGKKVEKNKGVGNPRNTNG